MSNLRVIAGKWRSRVIKIPQNTDIRPTPNRVRETLFNWLQPYINGANCLDLYAGSGALGIEALSRGAKHVTFVDINNSNLVSIKENIDTFGEEHKADFIFGDALACLKDQIQHKYDIIFVDPPYFKGLLRGALSSLHSSGVAVENALIYCEKYNKDDIIIGENWEIIKHNKYASVEFYLLKQG